MTPARLSTRLKEATRDLHRDAERAGGMGALLRGTIERHHYVLMLRNLHALYEALERALERHANLPRLAPVRMPALYRTQSLATDLRHLQGADWDRLPLLPAMRTYVAQIEERSRSRPELLAAHAYVRYMGDLNGGQVLRDIVRRALALDDGAGTAFYTFDGDAQAGAVTEEFRAALDAMPMDDQLAQEIVAEAKSSFALHIQLFEELGPGAT